MVSSFKFLLLSFFFACFSCSFFHYVSSLSSSSSHTQQDSVQLCVYGDCRDLRPRPLSQYIQAVTNAVSYGISIPVGIILVSNLEAWKFGDPAWFQGHALSQYTAFVIGLAGGVLAFANSLSVVGLPLHEFCSQIAFLLFHLAIHQGLTLFLRPRGINRQQKRQYLTSIYLWLSCFSTLILGLYCLINTGLFGLKDMELQWIFAYNFYLIIVLGLVAALIEFLSSLYICLFFYSKFINFLLTVFEPLFHHA